MGAMYSFMVLSSVVFIARLMMNKLVLKKVRVRNVFPIKFKR
jgi:hypothetical protein